jgi:hypothetical protein
LRPWLRPCPAGPEHQENDGTAAQTEQQDKAHDEKKCTHRETRETGRSPGTGRHDTISFATACQSGALGHYERVGALRDDRVTAPAFLLTREKAA